MRRALTALAMTMLAACSIGPRVSSFAPAVHPEGVEVELRSRTATFHAELLAVSDTGLLLLRDRALVFASYGAIQDATFQELSQEIWKGEPPDSTERRRLRLVSRFPQGVSAERLQALLTAYHQDSLANLEP